MRVEVYSHYEEGCMRKANAYLIESHANIPRELVEKIFSDPLAESCAFSPSEAQAFLEKSCGVEVFSKPGVTETKGRSGAEALGLFGIEAKVSAGEIYYIPGGHSPDELLNRVCRHHANSLIHRVSALESKRFSKRDIPTVTIEHRGQVRVLDRDDEESFFKMTQNRSLALSAQEVQAILAYFRKRKTEATDVELEIIAQTWSEHCKHKIFAANIDYSESEHPYNKVSSKRIEGLFKTYIEGLTQRLKKNFLVSVFKDNAGIVRFDDKIDLCFKVETHNSPSALDPYAGP